jgi:hypothetical protein
MNEKKAMPLADDLIVGAKSIGAELGMTERQAYHLLETKVLPGFKLGSKWAARRSRIRSHFDDLDGA